MALATMVVTKPAAMAASYSRLAGGGLLPRIRQYTQAPANCPARVPSTKPATPMNCSVERLVRGRRDAERIALKLRAKCWRAQGGGAAGRARRRGTQFFP